MLTPGEVAAMPRAPNSAVPMTRAMSLGPGRAILIREPRRSYIAERGAFGIRPEPSGVDRAALRKANPPGAGARADASVGEAVGIALCIFVNSRGSRQFRNVPSAANCRLVGERLKSTQSGD